jgi:hypothetical protein
MANHSVRRLRAAEYFKRLGIDPNAAPDAAESATLAVRDSGERLRALEIFPVPPLSVGSDVTTLPCVIECESFFFYTYCSVLVPGLGREFEGHSGGLGVGDCTGGGVIYFADQGALLATSDFGVTFVADTGGTVMVTWGTHGNANAVGVGEGAGAFGGTGSWKSSPSK